MNDAKKTEPRALADTRYATASAGAVYASSETEPFTVHLADITEEGPCCSHQIQPVAPVARRSELLRLLSNEPESAEDLWFDLLRHANFVDLARRGATLKNPYLTRKELSAYRHTLEKIVQYHNALVPPNLGAKYHDGFVYLQTPVCDDTEATSFRERRWLNILIPKLVNTSELYFLLCSPESGHIVCLPLVTKGGIVTVCTIQARTQTNAPNADPSCTQLVLLPFVPDPVPQHAVRLFESQTSPSGNDSSTLGRLSLTKRGASLVGYVQNLTWKRHGFSIGGTGCTYVTYSTWFEGEWNTADANYCAWRSFGNVTYQFDGHDISINVANLYVNPQRTHIIGCLSIATKHNLVLNLDSKVLPKVTAILFDLLPWSRRPALLFDTNPKLFFTGQALDAGPLVLNEPNVYETIVYAPYDIRIQHPAHLVKIDLAYEHIHGRYFIISGVPGNQHFYTGLSVWHPGKPLKISLWSPVQDAIIFRGTPIATLYLAHAPDGLIHDYSERTALRLLVTEYGDPRLHIGNLGLPSANFPCYDDLIKTMKR